MNMKFKIWLENLSLIGKVSSKEEMIEKYKNMSASEKQLFLNKIEEINKKEYAKKLGTNKPVLLYHGSPEKNIGEEGFKIKQGTRSLGFLGAPYKVENQGIFFTDSKAVADYFGQNRSELPGHSRIYSAYVNIDNILDATNPQKIPIDLRKTGLNIVNNYSGTNKKTLANSDVWRLLDRKDFIDPVKNLGYTGIKFKEDYNIQKTIQKQYKSPMGNSYLIFYIKNIIIKNNANDLIKDIDSLWNYIKLINNGSLNYEI